MRTLLFFTALLLLFASACVSSPKPKSLVGTTWGVVTIMSGDSVITITGRERPSITFITSTEFSGQTLCNSIGGSYTIESTDKMLFSMETMTMAMCPDNTIESVFIEQIGLCEFINLVGDTLKMRDGDGRTTMKLCKE